MTGPSTLPASQPCSGQPAFAPSCASATGSQEPGARAASGRRSLVNYEVCVSHPPGSQFRRIGHGTGLRRERMHPQRPEGPAPRGQRPPVPARAASAQIQLAYPVYPVRRADCGPAPITGLTHFFVTCHSAAGPGTPARASPGTRHGQDVDLGGSPCLPHYPAGQGTACSGSRGMRRVASPRRAPGWITLW